MNTQESDVAEVISLVAALAVSVCSSDFAVLAEPTKFGAVISPVDVIVPPTVTLLAAEIVLSILRHL